MFEGMNHIIFMLDFYSTSNFVSKKILFSNYSLRNMVLILKLAMLNS